MVIFQIWLIYYNYSNDYTVLIYMNVFPVKAFTSKYT